MDRIRLYVALGIAALWAVSYVVSVATGNFTGFQLSTPVMLVVAAWLLAWEDLVRRRNGKK